MGRFIAESYAPGRKIRRICSSLGTDYKIKRSDVKNVIWRDLGNGRALEVTGLDNLTEAVELWTFVRRPGGEWQVSAIQGAS